MRQLERSIVKEFRMKLSFFFLLVSAFIIIGCAGTPVRMVNGIKVLAPPPESDANPEILEIETNLQGTMDTIKLVLVNESFMIKEFDTKLGIIQTDFRELQPDERYDFTQGQQAVLYGMADVSGYKQMGRLQFVCQSKDSTNSTCQITGFIRMSMTQSNAFKDKTTESESKMIRIHPLVQKFACRIRKIDCGPAPGQKIWVPKSNQTSGKKAENSTGHSY